MSHAPAGWYDDGAGQQRYWDGQQWLDYVQPDVAPAHLEVTPMQADAELTHINAVSAQATVAPTSATAQNRVQASPVELTGALEVGPGTRERDLLRTIGIIGGWIALGILGSLLAISLFTETQVTDAVVTFALANGMASFIALTCLIKHRREAFVFWFISVLAFLVSVVLVLNDGWSVDSFSVLGFLLVGLIGAIFAVVASLRIDAQVDAGRRAQHAQRVAQESHDKRETLAQTAHERRVSEIRHWEAAYREAHGGQSPPDGFVPPAILSGGLAHERTNVLAILSLIFGIGGGLLGVIFGHIALKQIKETGERGAGMAKWGLSLGYLGLLALAIYLVVLLEAVA